MTYSYGREKMMTAVYALAGGLGPIAGRVHGAFMEFHPLCVDQLPDDLQSDYQSIRDFFDRIGPVDPYSDNPLASDEEYREIADRICHIAFALMRERD